MASEAQIEANRRNARKSTGPNTEDGKAAAAQNSLQHWLTARHLIPGDEKAQDFIAFTAAMRESLAPGDAVEQSLVERIILATWRLRRIARAERGLIDGWLGAGGAKDLLYGETVLSRLIERAPERLSTLSRYEIGLDRMLGRAHVQLERRQARRRGEAVPVPAAVLIESPDSIANLFDNNDNQEFFETKPILPAVPQGSVSRSEAPNNDASPSEPAESSERAG